MSNIEIIVAVDSKYGIAKKQNDDPGIIPWNLPTDQKYFRKKVSEAKIIATGWNTYAANKFHPFGKVTNIIFSRSHKEKLENINIVDDAEEFFNNNLDDILVVGGEPIYRLALKYATRVYITRVDGDFNCDVFFPEFESNFKLINDGVTQEENGTKFKFQIWESISQGLL